MAKPQASDPASSPRNPVEPQPQPGASTSAYATSPTDAASNNAATPTGTLIQNTQRQFTWTRLPPITGPSAAPSAPSADQVPSAFGRPDAGIAASSSDSDAGTIAPAPAAWTTRAAISRPTPGASRSGPAPAPRGPTPARTRSCTR